LAASLSMSIIIFIWPVIVAIFISYILGSRATFIYILIITLSVISIATARSFNLIPVNPVDEIRIVYSTSLIIILSSSFYTIFSKSMTSLAMKH
jgi:hypothetical protein